MTRKLRYLAALALFFLLVQPAGAILSIDITQGVRNPLPVALVNFSWEGSGERPFDVGALVSRDLRRSGMFRMINSSAFISAPHRPEDVEYKDWRLVGADALVIGRMAPAGDGRIEVRFRLFDVYSQEQIAGVRYKVKPGGLRGVAHRIADTIHEQLIGWSGAFATKIAYVVRENEEYRLMVADSDGASPRPILTSESPIMSPAWSPDGRSVAYVSFEQQRSMVYMQDLETGKRSTLAAFEGINSAPEFSPGGRRLALSLSRDGNAEIYVLDLQTRKLTRVTRHWAIDTEPTWSPDGDRLIFTSDRGGTPQLYRASVDGGEAERLTFEGKYNAAPTWSPDGKRVAFVHGDGTNFAVAVMNLQEEGAIQSLTERGPNESPSFAPNSRMILYATQGPNGKGELATVSVDGNVHQRLKRENSGDVREPAWSPMQP
ncbi:Tol-Pal system beta propeller repeat protein TolB [Thiohalorhabdus methylotrophus]|uniref:Tol-Pal system protein TolB n=1 Tax=Thiohalorhabdus methylotrophus TaxID=3242694 RepID=A0ABV4TR98_9GAMM